jgi:hypothetical protein
VTQKFPVLFGEELSDQQIFDAVVLHLLTQNSQCGRDDAGGCAYRSDDNLMACAVGCLLTDEECSRHGVEGSNIVGLLARKLLPQRLLAHTELLRCLQDIHDDERPGSWRDSLRRLAELRNLTMPAVKS